MEEIYCKNWSVKNYQIEAPVLPALKNRPVTFTYFSFFLRLPPALSSLVQLRMSSLFEDCKKEGMLMEELGSDSFLMLNNGISYSSSIISSESSSSPYSSSPLFELGFYIC